jgi:hypothetical protein
MQPRTPEQGDGGPAAQSQIAAPPAPFQSRQGITNLPASTNKNFRNPQGSPAGGTRPRHHTAAAPASAPMDLTTQLRLAGYKGKSPMAKYSHSVISGHPTQNVPRSNHLQGLGGGSGGGGRGGHGNGGGGNGGGGTRNMVRRGKPLLKPMDNKDFLEGARLYRQEHGRI